MRDSCLCWEIYTWD